MNDREQAGGGIQQGALERREPALATRLDGECRARRSTGLTIFSFHFHCADAVQGGATRAEGPAKQPHGGRWRGAAARYSSNDG
jgi:hypothetical protein